MQFPCARCGRTYEIADELCAGRAVKVACPACGNLAVHRVPAQGGAPAAAPAQPPPPPDARPAFAEADDDDFENAWSALEAPPAAEGPAIAAAPPPPDPAAWPSQPPLAKPAVAAEAEAPPAPAPASAPAPAPASAPAPAKPPPPKAPPPKAAPTAPARPAPVKRPAVPVEDEEPVMVTAELVLRRSTRRARLTAAAVAAAAVAALLGGGGLALQWKRSAPAHGVGDASRRGGGAATNSASAVGLSQADLAKLMGKLPVEPGSRPAAPASDRPKHEKLAGGDKDLLDLLAKKGDVAVTVQDEDALALSTSRGSLDEQAIEGTLSRSSGSFMACVNRAIAASPDQTLPAKRVNLELTIRPSGRVAKAAVQEEAIARLPLGQCIAQAAKRMVFPGFDGEPLDIIVPLKLKVGM